MMQNQCNFTRQLPKNISRHCFVTSELGELTSHPQGEIFRIGEPCLSNIKMHIVTPRSNWPRLDDTSGLVRSKDNYGIRVKKENYEACFKIVKPDQPVPDAIQGFRRYLIHCRLSYRFCVLPVCIVFASVLQRLCLFIQLTMVCNTCSNWSVRGNINDIDLSIVTYVPDKSLHLRRHELRYGNHRPLNPEFHEAVFRFVYFTFFRGVVICVATDALCAMLEIVVQDIRFRHTYSFEQLAQEHSHSSHFVNLFGVTLTPKSTEQESFTRIGDNTKALFDSRGFTVFTDINFALGAIWDSKLGNKSIIELLNCSCKHNRVYAPDTPQRLQVPRLIIRTNYFATANRFGEASNPGPQPEHDNFPRFVGLHQEQGSSPDCLSDNTAV